MTNVDKNVNLFFPNFYCKKCNYITSRKSQFTRHFLTDKHKMLTNVDIFSSESSAPKPITKLLSTTNFQCDCGKYFSYRQSLSVHKKKCNALNGFQDIQENQPITKELVLQLIQQNQKFQDIIFEQNNKMYELAKEGKSITTNNTTNSNNTQFNLNVFLNEQCKDAINLMDFVDSLNVKLKDLEYTSKTGYVEGISHIFITALSDLHVHTRPLHCSDSKREVLYIKENGVWQKDDEDKTKLTKAIKIIGNKNIQQIKEWQKVYPEYNDPSSKQNDKYMKMLCNAMSGSTKEEADKNYEKIIRNITREVVINKT